jgi:hypothetical protein
MLIPLHGWSQSSDGTNTRTGIKGRIIETRKEEECPPIPSVS